MANKELIALQAMQDQTDAAIANRIDEIERLGSGDIREGDELLIRFVAKCLAANHYRLKAIEKSEGIDGL